MARCPERTLGSPWVTGIRLATLLVGAFVAPALAAQSLATTQISRQIQAEQQVQVTVEYSAGKVRIRSADSRTMYALRLAYDPSRMRPVHEYENGRATLGVDRSEGNRAPILRGGFPDAEMDLTLSTRVAMDLVLQLGAVESDLDLGGLRLRSLKIETGASDSNLRVSAPNPEAMESVQIQVGAASFRAENLGNLNAATIDVEAGVGDLGLDFAGLRRSETRLHVEMGLGSLEIRVPQDAGIQLSRDSFLTSFDAPGLETVGDLLRSPNWSEADRRIWIEVDAAFGTVTIGRVP